jgi:hypothetical protein
MHACTKKWLQYNNTNNIFYWNNRQADTKILTVLHSGPNYYYLLVLQHLISEKYKNLIDYYYYYKLYTR